MIAWTETAAHVVGGKRIGTAFLAKLDDAGATAAIEKLDESAWLAEVDGERLGVFVTLEEAKAAVEKNILS